MPREAGDTLCPSWMGLFPYHRALISPLIPPHPAVQFLRASPPLIRHLPRPGVPRVNCLRLVACGGPLLSFSGKEGTAALFHRAPSTTICTPNPLLSCDGCRPSHGRATLLLSGRPEAYDNCGGAWPVAGGAWLPVCVSSRRKAATLLFYSHLPLPLAHPLRTGSGGNILTSVSSRQVNSGWRASLTRLSVDPRRYF